MNATDDDRDLAEALWRGETCLATDSIQFGDGTIAILSSDMPLSSRATSLKVLRQSTWLAVLVEGLGNPLHSSLLTWVSRLREIRTKFAGHQLRIESGECSGNGSFGYVAVEKERDSSSSELRWVAFFSGSNPFDELSIQDGVLHALSTSGYRYSFQLSDPTNVSIQQREDLTWWGKDEKNGIEDK
jgi:hypothetical protein